MILSPAYAGPALGVDPLHPRLAVVCAAADALVLAYIDGTVLVDPAPPAVVEAALSVAAHLWHNPDVPSGGTAGSAEAGTLSVGGDAYAGARALLAPYRGSVGAI